ncbi:MAG: hypothetical protein IKP66_02230 [Lachnospiraceae bacterium]|nr:hypothetical protein [Lachnospiraceae bacterium]
MAQNDFFPIVYRILAALYKNLKEDKENDLGIFECELYEVKQSFLDYILEYLVDEKFIRNVKKSHYDNDKKFLNLKNAQITPKGIEYLQDNSLMSKTKMFLKEIKASIPFI